MAGGDDGRPAAVEAELVISAATGTSLVPRGWRWVCRPAPNTARGGGAVRHRLPPVFVLFLWVFFFFTSNRGVLSLLHSDGVSHAFPLSRDALPAFDGFQVDAAGPGWLRGADSGGHRAPSRAGAAAAAAPRNEWDEASLLGIGEWG